MTEPARAGAAEAVRAAVPDPGALARLLEHPRAAIARATAAAPDWSGGTRIGAALKEFNDSHARRGCAASRTGSCG